MLMSKTAGIQLAYARVLPARANEREVPARRAGVRECLQHRYIGL